MALGVDSHGNVVMTGYSTTGFVAWGWPVYTDYYTVKFASTNGAAFWAKPSGIGIGEVAFDTDDNVVEWNGSHFIKYSHADGALISEGDLAVGLGSTHVWVGSSNVAVTGGRFETAMYTVTNGAVIWKNTFNGPMNGADLAQAVSVDGNGNVVVTGSSAGPNDGVVSLDFYTVKYDGVAGKPLWEKRHNGPANGDDSPVAMAVDQAGNVVVTGWETDPKMVRACYTAKYAAASGGLIWEKRSPVTAVGVFVDGGGDIVLVGTWPVDGGRNDFYAAKYSALDGALLWEKPNSASAIAVDGGGNVALIGSEGLAKLAASNGALLWLVTGPGAVEYTAVAADKRGDFIVAGTSGITSNDFNYHTAMYASGTGATLWAKTYNGPAKGYDFLRVPHPLALGPNGVIAVAGYSSAFTDPSIIFGGSNAYDFATVVYRELPVLTIDRESGGVRLRCTGERGRVCQVWRAGRVEEKGTLIHEQPVPDSGRFEITDLSRSGGPAFYHLEMR